MELRDLHPHTGAEVIGIRLDQPIDAETRTRLDRALADRGVLVFRNQRLDPPGFISAVGNFGPLMGQQIKSFCLPDHPIVGIISNRDTDKPGGKTIVRGAQYHTDHSNFVAPPRATALYGVNIPAQGGDTQFTSVHAAYADLPEAMKQRLAPLRSLHAYESSRSPRKMATLPPEERAKIPETEQPIIVRHPVNGRPGLYLNTGRMEGIVGMPPDEAYALIGTLMEHATQPKYEYRHRWQPGDLVIWDNRTVMHKANGDVPPDQYRYLYRLMVAGDPLLPLN